MDTPHLALRHFRHKHGELILTANTAFRVAHHCIGIIRLAWSLCNGISRLVKVLFFGSWECKSRTCLQAIHRPIYSPAPGSARATLASCDTPLDFGPLLTLGNAHSWAPWWLVDLAEISPQRGRRSAIWERIWVAGWLCIPCTSVHSLLWLDFWP